MSYNSMDHDIMVFKEGTKSILCITNGGKLFIQFHCSNNLLKSCFFTEFPDACQAFGVRGHPLFTRTLLVTAISSNSRPPNAVKHFALGVP